MRSFQTQTSGWRYLLEIFLSAFFQPKASDGLVRIAIKYCRQNGPCHSPPKINEIIFSASANITVCVWSIRYCRQYLQQISIPVRAYATPQRNSQSEFRSASYRRILPFLSISQKMKAPLKKTNTARTQPRVTARKMQKSIFLTNTKYQFKFKMISNFIKLIV